jgi:Flp pilus assembly protein TadB
MSQPLLYHIFFGLLVSAGVWLLLSGLTGRSFRRTSRERIEPFLGQTGQRHGQVTDLPPLAQRFLAQPLTDLGFFLFRNQDQASLDDRLRRSGWRYQSVGDYYGSKVSTAVTFFLCGLVVGLVIGFPPLLITLAAAGLGAWGLHLPDEELRKIITERRDALYREMAWTLDRMAMVMRTGEALEPALNRIVGENFAWVGGGSGGLFMALLRDIAAGMSTRRNDVKDMLDDLRRRLPDHMPELDEFMLAVQVNLEKREPIVEQLRALGRMMRDQLNNRIDEVAQKAELKVVALTSGVIVPALLIVVLGAAVLAFTQAF